jgi:hypothetical protein
VSNRSVGRSSRLRRGLMYALLALLLASAVVATFIPIQQQILRRRAERLLADIRNLELRRSTWTDAQEIFNHWGAWGHYDGTCTQQSCSYLIEFGDFANTHPHLAQRLLFFERAYRLLGGRRSLIKAGLGVQNGVIWSKGFSLFVEVPPERPPNNYEYTLIGSAWSASRLRSIRTSLIDHPNYLVSTPAGCTGCLAVLADFSPYADTADVERLMQFNLSCLTKRHPCREKAEIMPTAWTQYLKDTDAYNVRAATMALGCSGYPLKVLGRDTTNAAVVEVVASRMEGGTEDAFQVSRVRLVKKLKGASFWDVGTVRDVRVFAGAVNRTPHSEPRDVMPSTRFIFLFSHRHWGGPTGPVVWLDSCGAMPMTEQNLDEVQSGIGEDYLAGRGEGTESSID